MRLIHFITILLLCTQLYAEKKKSAPQDEISTQLNECTVLLKKLVEKEQNIQENREFIELQDEHHRLKARLDSYDLFIKETNSNISNQLAASSRNLTIVSIFSGILILLLGAHVSNIKQKITTLTAENNDLLNQTLKAKNEVERIDNEIKNRIPELYKKIKREEIESSLKKLQTSPEFISNYFNLLATSKLCDDDFYRLKNAMLNLSNPDFRDSYLILLLQFFAKSTFLDSEISSLAIEKVRYIHNNFTYDEMRELTKFVMLFISLNSIEKSLQLISNFFKNIEFLPNKEQIFSEIIHIFPDIDDQVLLFKAIPDEIGVDKGKMDFGKFLFNRCEQKSEVGEIKNFIDNYEIKK